METTFTITRIDHHGNVWGKNRSIQLDNEQFIGHAEELPPVLPGELLVRMSEPFDLFAEME